MTCLPSSPQQGNNAWSSSQRDVEFLPIIASPLLRHNHRNILRVLVQHLLPQFGSGIKEGTWNTEKAQQRSSFKLARMVEAVGSFGSRGVGIAGMSSSTLEEVQMQETLVFSDTIKVSSSFIQIRGLAFFLQPLLLVFLPANPTTIYLARILLDQTDHY